MIPEEITNLKKNLLMDSFVTKKTSSKKIFLFSLFFVIISFILVISSIYFSLNKEISPVFENVTDKTIIFSTIDDSGWIVKKGNIIDKQKNFCIRKEDTNYIEQTKQITLFFNNSCYSIELEAKKQTTPLSILVTGIIISLLMIFFFLFRNKELFSTSYVTEGYDASKINNFVKVLMKFLEEESTRLSYSEFKLLADKLYAHILVILHQTKNPNLIPLVYSGLIETIYGLGLKEKGEILYIHRNLLEKEGFRIEKRYGKYIGNILSYLSSVYYTSSIQLGLFVCIYIIFNAIILQSIFLEGFKNSSFLYYFTQVTSIASNLGGSIDLTQSTGELIYYVYLQVTGLILFGILLGIITKRIQSN